MLVLSRKPDESIVISDHVKITVLSIKGRDVRLGITAPADVAVHREEIYRKIKLQAENESGFEESNNTD